MCCCRKIINDGSQRTGDSLCSAYAIQALETPGHLRSSRLEDVCGLTPCAFFADGLWECGNAVHSVSVILTDASASLIYQNEHGLRRLRRGVIN